MPTTVPMIILFCEGSRPELPESLPFPPTLGAPLDGVAVLETASKPLVVKMLVKVRLPLTVTTVVTTSWVLLTTGNEVAATTNSEEVVTRPEDGSLSVDNESNGVSEARDVVGSDATSSEAVDVGVDVTSGDDSTDV